MFNLEKYSSLYNEQKKPFLSLTFTINGLTPMKLDRIRIFAKNISKQNKNLTSSVLSDYGVISNFRPLVPSKIKFFCNLFLFLNELSSNLAQVFKIRC